MLRLESLNETLVVKCYCGLGVLILQRLLKMLVSEKKSLKSLIRIKRGTDTLILQIKIIQSSCK